MDLVTPTQKHSITWRRSKANLALILSFITVAATWYFSRSSFAKPIPKLSKQTTDARTVSASELLHEAEALRTKQLRESNQAAIEKYAAAAEIWRAEGTTDQAAHALNGCGQVFLILGDLHRALRSYQEALKLAKQSRSQREEGEANNGLAYTYFLLGEAKLARQNSVAALNLAKLMDDLHIEAQALSNLGESFFSSGALATAQKYQRKASELFTQIGDRSGYALSQIALGYYNSNLSEPRAALEFFQRGLESAEQANDLRGQVLALSGMGNVKSKFGIKQEALEAFFRAQQLAERIGDRLFLASTRAGSGTIYFRLGDAQKAMDYLLQGIRGFEEIKAPWGIAEAQLELGRVSHSLGNNEEALKYLTQALSNCRLLGMKRLEAQALEEIGLVQTTKGDFEKALQTFDQSLSLNRSGQDFRHEANILNLIGKVYENLKQPDRAFHYYELALPRSRVAQDPAGESTALFNLARLERDRGSLPDSEQKLEEAIKISESIRAQILNKDLRASYFATIHQIYELYIDVLMLHHKMRPNDGAAARAFAISEKARARSFLEFLTEGQAEIREGVDEVLLQKEQLLSETLNAKADLQIKLLSSKNTLEANRVQQEIDSLTSEYDKVSDQIRETSPRYAALTLPQPLSLEEVQQRLMTDDSILLEYSLGDDRSYVWMVTRSTIEAFELPSRKIIEDLAKRLYGDLIANQLIAGEPVEQHAERERKASESISSDTALLSQLVLGPLAGKLGNKRLLIVADGALQYLPFQALNDPDSKKESPQLLLERHEIVNELSASTLALLLQEAKHRKGASNSVAVLADPVFEVDDPRVRRATYNSTPESAESVTVKKALRDVGISTDGVQIPRLLASSEEADAIIGSAPWGTGLKAVGFEASRRVVLGQQLGGYRIIHFATHGLINNEHTELSGIVLSLFDQQGRSQDGFLRLHDIYNLHLPADLVVLSACSTGLGKDVRGEGLIGLTRGFMYAGASGVVASLWKVDDQATAELMKLFYEGMFQKELSPVAALREAQLTMSRQKPWESPYYWAGFVIQGRYDQQVSGSPFMYRTPQRITAGVGLALTVLIASLFLFLRRRRRII